MKIIIVGRTGSGKTTLAQKLNEYGMSVMKTYTTRPKRTENENSYIFVSKEEAEKITDKALVTYINGYEYFSTPTAIETSDILILDPNGVNDVTNMYPDTEFAIVYIHAENTDTARHLAAKREPDFDKGLENFDKRYNAENEMFTAFEQSFDNKEKLAENIKLRFDITNDFTEFYLDNSVARIIGEIKTVKHMSIILKQLVNRGIIEGDHKGIITVNPDNEHEKRTFGFETIALACLSIPEKFRETVGIWLSLYDPTYAIAPLPECDSKSCVYCTDEGRCAYERVTGKRAEIDENLDTGCTGFSEKK